MNPTSDAIVNAAMDVYLVPVGASRYKLYCEVPDEPDEPSQTDAPSGFIQRIKARFQETLAEAERERRSGAHGPVEGGWTSRMKARTMRWVAESIAEQRLLWHLRRQTAACLHYPDDVDETVARGELRAQLGRDFEKHRFWLIVDTTGFVGSGALMLLPGPNVLAYYFAFRLVGHYFSMRGASRGLRGMDWRPNPSPPLTELRRAIGMDAEQRTLRVNDVALKLRLEHLASFFERTAVPSA